MKPVYETNEDMSMDDQKQVHPALQVSYGLAALFLKRALEKGGKLELASKPDEQKPDDKAAPVQDD